METDEEKIRTRNFRKTRSRPELGLGPSRALGNILSTPSSSTAQQPIISILGPTDSLPSYVISSLPRKISRRKRPSKATGSGIENGAQYVSAVPEDTGTLPMSYSDNREETSRIVSPQISVAGADSDSDVDGNNENVDWQDTGENAMDFVSQDIQVPAVGVLESYRFQVFAARSLMMLDGNVEFVVQDFDAVKLVLKPRKFCFVTRKPLMFVDTTKWAKHCFGNCIIIILLYVDLLEFVVHLSDVLKTSHPKTYVRKAVSTKPIPSMSIQSQASMFNGTLASVLDVESSKLVPDFSSTICPDCGSFLEENAIEWNEDGCQLLTQKMIFGVLGKLTSFQLQR
eukprot:gene6471-7208_t